jgi:hypothetical protein
MTSSAIATVCCTTSPVLSLFVSLSTTLVLTVASPPCIDVRKRRMVMTFTEFEDLAEASSNVREATELLAPLRHSSVNAFFFSLSSSFLLSLHLPLTFFSLSSSSIIVLFLCLSSSSSALLPLPSSSSALLPLPSSCSSYSAALHAIAHPLTATTTKLRAIQRQLDKTRHRTHSLTHVNPPALARTRARRTRTTYTHTHTHTHTHTFHTHTHAHDVRPQSSV